VEKISLALQILSFYMTAVVYFKIRDITKNAAQREALTRKFIENIRTKVQEAKRERNK
jgi:hypothetical protein